METIRSLVATSARSPGSLAPSSGDGSLLAIDALRPTESADRHVFDVRRREADCRERIAHVPPECQMVSVRRKDVDDNKSTALASSRDRVKRARREVTERLSPRSNRSLISLERRVGIRLPMEDRHDADRIGNDRFEEMCLALNVLIDDLLEDDEGRPK
jgi:hypothetical protein